MQSLGKVGDSHFAIEPTPAILAHAALDHVADAELRERLTELGGTLDGAPRHRALDLERAA